MRNSRKKIAATAITVAAVGLTVAAAQTPSYAGVSGHTARSSHAAPAASGAPQSLTERRPTGAVKVFRVAMSGDQEVDTVGSCRGTATARLAINPNNGVIRFRDLTPKLLFIREDEFGPISFHIHRGAAGTNGDVVVDLTELADQGQTSGRIKVDPALAQEIAADPSGFYVNYHTISFPKGAVRGQVAG
jgi:hypothetical protein